MEYGFGNQTFCRRAADKGLGTDGAGGLTKDGNVIRIAAKGADVLSYPGQGSNLIPDAQVIHIFSHPWVAEKAENINAVVDGDKNNASPTEDLAVKLNFMAETVVKGAAMNPERYRKISLGTGCWCPDVQVQAVFIQMWPPLRGAVELFFVE